MAIKFTTQPVAKNATSRGLDTLSAAECKLQDKTVEYVENSQYEILPDEGYDGIAKVDVTVNVPIPEPKLQSKNYNIVTNGDTTITPDAGFVGINGGTISVNVPTPEPKLQEKSTTISQNGASSVTPDSGYDGLSQVDITVQVPEKTIQANKTVSITANGQTIVSPDPNNDGMAQVTVDVNVSGGGSIDVVDNGIKFSNSTFTEVPDVFTGWDKLEDGNFMFYNCDRLTSWNIELPALTNGNFMFNNCDSLTSWNIELPALTNGSSMFSYCGSLTSFSSNLSSLTNGNSMFNNCGGLIDFTLSGTLNCDGFNLTSCTQLTVDSLVNVISVLVDLTGQSSKTLKLGSTNLNKLSEEQKAVATNKNWVLA